MKTRTLAAMLLLVVLGWTQPVCGQQTAVRFVHTVYDLKPVDVHFSSLPFFLKKTPLSVSSVRTELPALTYDVQIRDTQSVNPPLLHSSTMTLTDGINQSLVLMGRPDNLSSLTLSWDRALPQLGNIKLRFVHAATSVSAPISVLVNGSVFFLSVNRYNATGFIEVPLSQAATLAFAQASNGATIARYNASGAFESDNVYTIYFLDGPDGPQARFANETSIDEQVPMQMLPRSGSQYAIRTVHVSSNSPSLGMDIGGISFMPRLHLFMASTPQLFFADGDFDITLYPESSPGQVLAEQTVSPGSEERMSLIVYNLQNNLLVMPLSWNGVAAPAGKARIRVVNTSVGLAQASVYNGSDPVFELIPFGQATEFREVDARSLQLRIRNEATQTNLTEVVFTPAEQKVYTLFLTNGQSGTEVRVMEETNPALQAPLLLLNEVIQSQARLRVVSLAGAEGQALRVHSDEQVISDRIGYADAGEILTGFPLGSHTFTARDADMPDAGLLTDLKGTVENDRSFLLLFAGPFDDTQGWLYATPKGKITDDSLYVRFVHAMTGQKEISILADETGGGQVVKPLSYGDASSYAGVATPQQLRVVDEGGTELGTVVINQTEPGAVTVFLVPEDGRLAAYMLPDETPEAFRPMTRLETVVSVQDDPMNGLRISGPFPAPLEETALVTVSLPVASSVALQLTDMLGRPVWQTEGQWYAAGQHNLTIERRGLPAGVYFLQLEAGNRRSVLIVTIR